MAYNAIHNRQNKLNNMGGRGGPRDVQPRPSQPPAGGGGGGTQPPGGGGGGGTQPPGGGGGQGPPPGTLTYPPGAGPQQSSAMKPAAFGSTYNQNVQLSGGPSMRDTIKNAGESFAPVSRLQGATPFWDSPGIQVAGQEGYEPGQQFAGMNVSGDSIQNHPFVQAAMNDYLQNVQPGIQNKFTSMGLGRSNAAGEAMSKAQAGMLLPLYQQAAGLEESRINRMTGAGEASAQRSQQGLNRLLGATESEMGRRTDSADKQAAAQQQMFDNLRQMAQMQNSQRQSGAEGLFGMGAQGRDYAQQANQSSYQDYLRRMGLSEEALNPFGGVQGLLGTVTNGK